MKKLTVSVFPFLFSFTFATAGEVEGRLEALALRGNVPSGIYSGICRTDFTQPLNIPCEVTVEAINDSYNANFVNKTTGEGDEAKSCRVTDQVAFRRKEL